MKMVIVGLGVDVSGVEDGVGGAQIFQHLGPQQAVGIGENGELHGTRPP